MNYNANPFSSPSLRDPLPFRTPRCHRVGPTVLTNPGGCKHLVGEADQGGFPIRSGDFSPGCAPLSSLPRRCRTAGPGTARMREGLGGATACRRPRRSGHRGLG
jgi:hypothetical protein